jgi:hypothetical protein
MAYSKLQSVEPCKLLQTSNIAEWQVFFCLREMVVHWLRHFRFWYGSSSISSTN